MCLFRAEKLQQMQIFSFSENFSMANITSEYQLYKHQSCLWQGWQLKGSWRTKALWGSVIGNTSLTLCLMNWFKKMKQNFFYFTCFHSTVLRRINPFHAGNRIFCSNYVSIVSSDPLAYCFQVIRSHNIEYLKMIGPCLPGAPFDSMV